LTGHSVALQILGDLKLNPAGSFYSYVLNYLVASAGLTPVYDATNHPEFLKNVAGISLVFERFVGSSMLVSRNIFS
jgi:hypothetical protein